MRPVFVVEEDGGDVVVVVVVGGVYGDNMLLIFWMIERTIDGDGGTWQPGKKAKIRLLLQKRRASFVPGIVLGRLLRWKQRTRMSVE